MNATRSESDFQSRWFYDHQNRQWKVKLLNGDAIKPGDVVEVKSQGRVFQAFVKQVAGFGFRETRPIITVSLPGRSRGIKVHIDDVVKVR